MSELNLEALEIALRKVTAHMDYDLSKSIENVYGEREEDEFPYFTKMLAYFYAEAVVGEDD